MTLYQMLSQAVESVDPQLMRAKIEDFEKTFEQRHGRKMRDDELAMLKTAKEIVERELWGRETQNKGSLELCHGNGGLRRPDRRVRLSDAHFRNCIPADSSSVQSRVRHYVDLPRTCKQRVPLERS